jgi:hypothetical protein
MESGKIESLPPPRLGGERVRKAGEGPFDLLAVLGRRGHSPMDDCETPQRSRHFALVLAAMDQEAGKDACASLRCESFCLQNGTQHPAQVSTENKLLR